MFELCGDRFAPGIRTQRTHCSLCEKITSLSGSLFLFSVLEWAALAVSLWLMPWQSESSMRRPSTSTVMSRWCAPRGTTWCRRKTSTSSFTMHCWRRWPAGTPKSLRGTCTPTSRGWRRLNQEKMSPAWSWSSRSGGFTLFLRRL